MKKYYVYNYGDMMMQCRTSRETLVTIGMLFLSIVQKYIQGRAKVCQR